MKKQHQLVLLNDNENSFDDIINVLCEVLGHNIYQAEQCATIVHNKGRCVIYSGDKSDLLLYQKMLTDEGVTTEVEKEM